MFENRARWLPLFRALRTTLDFPRRMLPEFPWVSEWVALPDGELQLGQEWIPPGEPELIERTIAVLRARHRRSYPSGVRPMLRDFHTKAHGAVVARFTVEPDLPAPYRFGLFAEARCYQAIVRFSNGQRAVESDHMPTPHGVAIKLVEVPDRQSASGPTRTIDLLLADYPVNLIGTVADRDES
jgi:hypothetical protein